MRRQIVGTIAYALLLLAFFFSTQAISSVETVTVAPRDGRVDVTENMTLRQLAMVDPEDWDYYPKQLLTPDDFRKEESPLTPSPDPITKDIRYGTFRLMVTLVPGQTYAISGKSWLFAQRVYIDGDLMGEIGSPGASKEKTTADFRYYTYYFTPENSSVELILQTANFHYADMDDVGRHYPVYIGVHEVVTLHNQQRTFITYLHCGCLIAIVFLFLGFFFYFPKQIHFLLFAVICGLIAIRTLVTDTKILLELFPNLSWVFTVRLEYVTNILIANLMGIYFYLRYRTIYPFKFLIGTLVAPTIFLLLTLFTEPIVFTQLSGVFLLYAAALSAVTLVRTFMTAFKRRIDDILTLLGLSILLAGAIVEIGSYFFVPVVYAIQNCTMICIFLMTIAISLELFETEKKLTESSAKERALREENKLLEHLTQIKTDFLQNISHEMRTPLTVMSSYAQLSEEEIALGIEDENTRAHLITIALEASRLDKLVERLLEISKARQTPFHLAPISPVVIANNAIKVYAMLAQRKGNQCIMECDEDLPMVYANEDMLQQVMLNILSNANRSTHNGWIQLTVRRASENDIEFIIADNGEGIHADLLPHVFEWSVSGNENGSGIGLSICKEIIEKHGGEILVESSPGEKTIVRFTLPVYRMEAME